LVDISLQKTVKTATRVGERTEPDLDLIKQVEQVTTSDLEGPAWRFAGIPRVGITYAVEVLVFLIWQLLNWLLFGCKTASEARPSGMLPAPRGGPRTGPHGLSSRCSAKFELGNLACYPDFKVSQYPVAISHPLRPSDPDAEMQHRRVLAILNRARQCRRRRR